MSNDSNFGYGKAVEPCPELQIATASISAEVNTSQISSQIIGSPSTAEPG
jgi:hypothetical protein